MQIQSTTHVHGAHGLQGPHSTHRTQSPLTSQAKPGVVDRVDISAAAEAASHASETGGVRHALVNQLRAQIAAGTYETPEKMEAALERMFDKMA